MNECFLGNPTILDKLRNELLNNANIKLEIEFVWWALFPDLGQISPNLSSSS